MKDPCYNCCRKHLANALVLMLETVQGYPMHGWEAVGQMDQAAAEIILYSKEIADRIRDERLKYMDSLDAAMKYDEENDVFEINFNLIYKVPILELIKDVTKLALFIDSNET